MNVTFGEALRVWIRIGLLSFGGPAGQIALLHKELVEQRGWLGEAEFLRALNFCMLLPGPEAMQLATYCGWKLHGQKGGVVAGGLFVLPGAMFMLALSALYSWIGDVALVQSLFWGIKVAVVAIVFQALVKIANKALKRNVDWLLAGMAFIALFGFGLPFPLVVLLAGLFGLITAHSKSEGNKVARPSLVQTLQTIMFWLCLWLVPLFGLMLAFGRDHVFSKLAVIFSTLAVVTFGGAYAVLASLGQSVVENSGWMTPQQMMDGFGLAETTPGPLILVGQFVAFTSAKTVEGDIWAGLVASGIFLWMTFAPCFLWIFAGAPWIEWLDSWPRIRAALAAITAAVTGVILNLSLWFALHVLFGKAERLAGLVPVWWPDWRSFDGAALILALGLGFALIRLQWSIPKTLATGLVAGLIWHFTGLIGLT